MSFRKLPGVCLPEEKQGLIRYTCLDWRAQPVWVQEKIRYICEQVAGAYQHALFEVMTTNRSITAIAMEHAISESLLYAMRKSFYERW